MSYRFARATAGVAIMTMALLPFVALANTGSDIGQAATVPAAVSQVSGKVTAINGSIVTFSTGKGVIRTIDLSAVGLKMIRRYGAAMAASDLQVNDQIIVRTALTSDGAVTPMLTVQDLSLQAHNGTFVGTVASVDGSSFVITSKERGNQTINTTATTKFKQEGVASATIANVSVGETVTVSGVWDRTNSLVTANAVTVKVVTMKVTGTVTSVSATMLKVTDAKNIVYTIDISNAKFMYKGYRSGEAAMIAVNDQVIVLGGKAAAGTTSFAAKTVRDTSKTYVKPAKATAGQ